MTGKESEPKTEETSGADNQGSPAGETPEADVEIVEGEVVDAESVDTDAPIDGDSHSADVDSDGIEDAEADDEVPALRAELAERTLDLQRLSAEYANYRRRVERDRQSANLVAKASVITEILPLADDLDRARDHGDLEDGPLKSFADKITTVLTNQGVEQFGAEGDPFDPAQHEAVQDESDGESQSVGVVLRKGYRMGEQTLRPAMVTVK